MNPPRRTYLRRCFKERPPTRQCTRCLTHRDSDDLFSSSRATICELCRRIEERTKEGLLHKSQRQVDYVERVRLTPAEKYRRALEKESGYSPEQIDEYVTERFPNNEEQIPNLQP